MEAFRFQSLMKFAPSNMKIPFFLPFTKDLPKGTYGDNAKTSAKCCKLLALMASSRPERDNRDEFLLFPAIRDGLWNEFSSDSMSFLFG